MKNHQFEPVKDRLIMATQINTRVSNYQLMKINGNLSKLYAKLCEDDDASDTGSEDR